MSTLKAHCRMISEVKKQQQQKNCRVKTKSLESPYTRQLAGHTRGRHCPLKPYCAPDVCHTDTPQYYWGKVFWTDKVELLHLLHME